MQLKQINNRNCNTRITTILPKGEKSSKDIFTGNVYPTALVDTDSIYSTLVSNVSFEAGARSN